jgi:heteromeric Ino2p/Ino4p transcription factor
VISGDINSNRTSSTEAAMDMDGSNDKPRLSAEQKKKNHIESEKKRREAIRAGFEKLSRIVPDCEGQARSEAVVLQRTVAYLREQLDQKEALRRQAIRQGLGEGEFEKM